MASFYNQSTLGSNKYGENKAGKKIGNNVVMGKNPNYKYEVKYMTEVGERGVWLSREDIPHRGNRKGPKGSMCLEYSKNNEVANVV